MFCNQCGASNPEGSAFCGQCGAPLGTGAHLAHILPAKLPAAPKTANLIAAPAKR